ncbi:MAG: SDR family NAD(P)-dependent oxidoreductase, partial [Actinomycetota bacterium]
MTRLAGKVALITGAASGLGRVGAERFAAEGARVVIADVGDSSETMQAIARAGGTAASVECDVSDDASVRDAIAFAVKTFGDLHVLYNNAGVMLSADDDPVSTPDDVIEKTLDVNVKGVLYACRHAIPHMIESAKKCGETSSIVNVASFVAHLGAATPQIAYTASKGAVLAMTRETAAIYARRGVRANALCPG